MRLEKERESVEEEVARLNEDDKTGEPASKHPSKGM